MFHCKEDNKLLRASQAFLCLVFGHLYKLEMFYFRTNLWDKILMTTHNSFVCLPFVVMSANCPDVHYYNSNLLFSRPVLTSFFTHCKDVMTSCAHM